MLRGLLIYSAGDTTAALLTSSFSVSRLAGIMAVGGFVYSWEIPAWFEWIASRYTGFGRAAMAVLYFNPLWIARHLLFVCVASGDTAGIRWSLLSVALRGFVVNLPVIVAANYLIQNRIPLKWRFMSSAVFSALLAVYYPLCRVMFE